MNLKAHLNDGLSPPEDDPARTGAIQVPVLRWAQGESERIDDWVAEEVPVALVFNGISHAVMMATPADLDDFALGFAITEGLLSSPSDLYGVEVQQVADGIEVHLDVSSETAWRLRERRRNLAGRTGCGLCGTDSLAQVCRSFPQVPTVSVDVQAVLRAEAELKNRQRIQKLTGATHAAGWCDSSGQIVVAREDVGRHNALDKLLGALIRSRIDLHQGFIAITSRASFEMVQKAAVAGAGMLIAVSAPTALAVQTAIASNLALAGLVRDGRRLVAYTWPERFGLS